MNEQLALQKILRDRFTGLQTKNPAYSIRAFSKKVGVTPGTLSLILLGKRKASAKLATKIAAQLMLDPQERSEVLGAFTARQMSAQKTDQVDPSYLQLNADQFHLVADWQYFAILNLLQVKNFKSDVNWIADRLGLTVNVVETALERLKRLEMVTEDEAGNLKRTHSQYRTTDDMANISLRKSHHQTLDLATESLDRDSVEERDFTWITYVMDPASLPQAKTLIRKFQDELTDLLEATGEPTEVYRLAIQMFPLTKVSKKKAEIKTKTESKSRKSEEQ